jgi:Gpi18-like mannosyltransferase
MRLSARLSELRFPVALFLATRLAWVTISWLGLTLVPQFALSYATPRGVLASWPAFDGFFRWDSGYYVVIATSGYTDVLHTNFWPLYPALSRLVSGITTLTPAPALLLVANVASLLSYVVIFRVFERRAGPEVARAGLLAFACYPFAFFQAAAYPESLTVLLTAASVLLADRFRHATAGLVLALGTLTRHTALFTGFALLAAHLRERGWRGLWHVKTLALLLPLLGPLAYMLFLQDQFSDALMFLKVRERWKDGYVSVFKVLQAPRMTEFVVGGIISVVPALGTVVLLRKREWRDLGLISLAWFLILFTYGGTGLGRHSASCWPAFLAMGAVMGRWRDLQAPILAGMCAVQGLLFFLFSHHFHVY